MAKLLKRSCECPSPPAGPGAPEQTDPPYDPYADYELQVESFRGTPGEIERQWFEKCFKGRGDTLAQLTWRAVIMGSFLGAILNSGKSDWGRTKVNYL